MVNTSDIFRYCAFQNHAVVGIWLHSLFHAIVCVHMNISMWAMLTTASLIKADII